MNKKSTEEIVFEIQERLQKLPFVLVLILGRIHSPYRELAKKLSEKIPATIVDFEELSHLLTSSKKGVYLFLKEDLEEDWIPYDYLIVVDIDPKLQQERANEEELRVWIPTQEGDFASHQIEEKADAIWLNDEKNI